MSSDLRLDWCSYAAAKYAVENWHYSHKMPAFKVVKIGVWEPGFIGCVMFARGANNAIGSPYDINDPKEVCELVRVALKAHQSSVSKILAIAIRMLKKQSLGLRLIVSYADTAQDHLGIVYQAGNWFYTGLTRRTNEILVNGQHIHKRRATEVYGTCGIEHIRKVADPNARLVPSSRKHCYIYPLNKTDAERLAHMAKPYPKRDKQAMAVSSGTAAGQRRPSRSNTDGQQT